MSSVTSKTSVLFHPRNHHRLIALHGFPAWRVNLEMLVAVDGTHTVFPESVVLLPENQRAPPSIHIHQQIPGKAGESPERPSVLYRLRLDPYDFELRHYTLFVLRTSSI